MDLGVTVLTTTEKSAVSKANKSKYYRCAISFIVIITKEINDKYQVSSTRHISVLCFVLVLLYLETGYNYVALTGPELTT